VIWGFSGTWSTFTVASADALAKIPGAASSFPLEAAALAAPATAIALVKEFAALKAGDVIVQNNAGSTVGQAVIAYAASKGIKTINIMRQRWGELLLRCGFGRCGRYCRVVCCLQ
jgi:mitochondrial enoyl-[acyl-carrier protein] reductase / trans-2-enoyl-CoA reductase